MVAPHSPPEQFVETVRENGKGAREKGGRALGLDSAILRDALASFRRSAAEAPGQDLLCTYFANSERMSFQTSKLAESRYMSRRHHPDEEETSGLSLSRQRQTRIISEAAGN